MWFTVAINFLPVSLVLGEDEPVVPLRTIFGANVRQLRRQRGLSQATLAEQADISIDMVGRIERGQASPSFDTVEAIAAVLSVSATALVAGGDALLDTSNPRGNAVQRINGQLARASDAQLELIERLIAAALEKNA
ncbi:helix-turn-helix transcriptional regulator [Magnetospirillum sp. 64-120]|uniref:helix-turn-helix domain-containing protein n=1 Tax=Magnetospirillum sp. 64-120 TaxID=1895778 RepID=UPI0025C2FF7D|nr:helix-turn-helix transcriptional regulator [Magnetospirillum sp. 64-120]